MILYLKASTLQEPDGLIRVERTVWCLANVGYYFIILGEPHLCIEHMSDVTFLYKLHDIGPECSGAVKFGKLFTYLNVFRPTCSTLSQPIAFGFLR